MRCMIGNGARILAAGLLILVGLAAGPVGATPPGPPRPATGPCQADAAGPAGARMFGKLDPRGTGRVGPAAFVAHRLRHFVSLDANGDGRVSRAEFDAPHPGGESAEAASSFERFDTDHDGVISREEWIAGETHRFERIDANHDGVVTRSEFLADRRRVCAARRIVASAGGR